MSRGKPNIRSERHVEYKRIKVLMPHCSVCKEQLSGNNSIAMPYKCSCGTWKHDWFKPEWEIIKNNEND